MHNCSDLPDITKQNLEKDEKCAKLFRKHYIYNDPVEVLGKGSIATVFNVYSKTDINKQIAVKILPYGPDLDKLSNKELGIACELNSLRELSPIFVYTMGYIVCSAVPNEWKRKMDVYKDEPLYLYMFMHKPQVSFDERDKDTRDYKVASLDEREYAISLLFILLHGIYVGRKLFEFVHHDIHAKNVMFAYTEDDHQPFKLSVENVEHNVSFIPHYVPKLIDFGRSSTKTYVDERSQNLGNDVETIFNLFNKRNDLQKSLDLSFLEKSDREKNIPDPETGRFTVYKKEYEELITSKYNNPGVIAKFLLHDDLFKNVRTINRTNTKKQKTKKIQSCITCGGGEMKFEFKNREGGVCHEFCARQIGPLTMFLPFK